MRYRKFTGFQLGNRQQQPIIIISKDHLLLILNKRIHHLLIHFFSIHNFLQIRLFPLHLPINLLLLFLPNHILIGIRRRRKPQINLD